LDDTKKKDTQKVRRKLTKKESKETRKNKTKEKQIIGKETKENIENSGLLSSPNISIIMIRLCDLIKEK
jgi:hypothetical protein